MSAKSPDRAWSQRSRVQNLRIGARRGARSGRAEGRWGAGPTGEERDRGPHRARSVARRCRSLPVPDRMARRPQHGGDVIRRFCGETAEVHAEPTIWPKSGPCGANYCMSRNRAPKGSPSQVKRHSPDRDARPDVLPFFFCFVICGVCPLVRYARCSRRDLCGSGFGLSCRGVRTTMLDGMTVARAGVEAVAGVRLRVFAVPCCLCWCRLCDQFRCTCSRGDGGRRGRVTLL